MFKSKVVMFEVTAFVVVLILGALWMMEPAGDYEPFFAFASLSFIGLEMYRRGPISSKKSRKVVNNITPIQGTSDDEFMLLGKIEKLSLSSNTYQPEDNELNLCISLTNKGYFYKDGDYFVLTPKCLEYLGKQMPNKAI